MPNITVFFDSMINRWLIEEGGLDVQQGQPIGVCAESNCRYLNSVSFPQTIEAGLRIVHIGNSSVRYEIGLFAQDTDKLIAEGWVCPCFCIKRKAGAYADSRETKREDADNI